MLMDIVRWIVVLLIAFLAGKAVSKWKLPAILGWLIAGMILGPNALGLLPQKLRESINGHDPDTVPWYIRNRNAGV